MDTILRYSIFGLPLVLAGVGAILKGSGGLTAGHSIGFAAALGAVLGLTLHFVLSSFATLVGQARVPKELSSRALMVLEHDKRVLLRSIKELEFDASLGRLSPEEAERLADPLKQRAVRLLRELDVARSAEGSSVDAQIQAELDRRLGRA